MTTAILQVGNRMHEKPATNEHKFTRIRTDGETAASRREDMLPEAISIRENSRSFVAAFIFPESHCHHPS
jgi:hypothetical protein